MSQGASGHSSSSADTPLQSGCVLVSAAAAMENGWRLECCARRSTLCDTLPRTQRCAFASSAAHGSSRLCPAADTIATPCYAALGSLTLQGDMAQEASRRAGVKRAAPPEMHMAT